jgi:putative phosphoesterase
LKSTIETIYQQGTIGILSDAHGNGPAFNRAIEILEQVGANSFWFLGDSIGYIPSLEVVDSIKVLGTRIRCVSGNHEQMVISKEYESQYDDVYQHSFIRSQITESQLAEIESWPLVKRFQIGLTKIMLCHGSPTDLTAGYVYEDSDLSAFSPDADFVFMGNTHRPFIRKNRDVVYVNVGSCGLPRDDGATGSVGIFEPSTGKVAILRFNIEKETISAISCVTYVHDTVIDLTKRRSDNTFGEFV